jgi:5'-methylthioadenosine phosphorylase
VVLQSPPAASLAIIGGSGTQGGEFPDGLHPGARVIDRDLVVATPFGESPPFTLFEIDGRSALHVRMHGWRAGVERGVASRQVFSVLHAAGVRRILSEAGVGSLNRLLDPGDLLVCDDFVDLTTGRAGGGVVGGHLLIMREALCATARAALRASAQRRSGGRRVFARGVYVVTEGPRFETPAEVRFLQTLGDVVGQSLSPEAWLARDIGACYAALQIVVNYGEGVVEEWSHDELARIFHDDAAFVGQIMLEALAALPDDDSCRCRELRKPTLLA